MVAEAQLRPQQHIFDWVSERRFRTGKVQFNDYDYLKPKKEPPRAIRGVRKVSRTPSWRFTTSPESTTTKTKAKTLLASGSKPSRRLITGATSGAMRPPARRRPGHRRETSRLSGEQGISGRACGARVLVHALPVGEGRRRSAFSLLWSRRSKKDQVYYGSYVFQPSDRPFRLLPVTPKPRIHGIQTAKVVGKKGEENEEISTDEHGRIWVQFFWDREPQLTCPIRVAQVWASKKWGGLFVPRIGMEVVVEFLEGDPDRPLVVGTVYNGDNKTPYTLPDNKTMAGVKSDSSKGGNGYNEFVFEDKKSSENIRMHAQKDNEVIIRHAQTETIGQDFVPPKGDASRTITLKHGDDQLTIQTGDQRDRGTACWQAARAGSRLQRRCHCGCRGGARTRSMTRAAGSARRARDIRRLRGHRAASCGGSPPRAASAGARRGPRCRAARDARYARRARSPR